MTPAERAPAEVIVLRSFGLIALLLFVAETVTTRPEPALHGRGLVLLVAAIACVVAAIATQPQRGDLPASYRVATLGLVTATAAVLAAIQPNGIWEAGPYYVGIIAALRLERRTGVIVLVTSLVVLVAVAGIAGHLG
ncbi:MAG: hypothetical protein ABSH51_27820, partial [Solirubrobacteraceae bacterium]